MSHFCLLVATKERPTRDVLDNALQPFHEFECTGKDDEYVQDVDKTEEMRKEYEQHTYKRFRDRDGVLHDPHEDFMPEGMVEVEVPATEIFSFAEFIKNWHGLDATNQPDVAGEHKYGYVLIDESGEVVKVIDRTNPRAKWDYWRVGGRYAWSLWAVNPARAYRTPLSWEWAGTPPEDCPIGFDICQKHNLDTSLMRTTLPVFAVLKDGQWCEKGEMGYWGIVFDEKEDWESTFVKLVDSIPDDYWLSVVDCHI